MIASLNNGRAETIDTTSTFRPLIVEIVLRGLRILNTLRPLMFILEFPAEKALNSEVATIIISRQFHKSLR